MSNVIDGFTRQETLALTGTTPNQLFYLEKTGLIIPTRIGSNKRPTVIFSWEQILEIRAIRSLRSDTSLQSIRKVIDYLNEYGFEDQLRDKLLVAVDDQVFWIRSDWSDFHKQKEMKALVVASKGNKGLGQYTLTVLPSFKDIVEEIWRAAESSSVVDFESFKARAKAKPA